MKRIQRDVYLKQLLDKKDNGLIKIITGIRRCGKSYLLDPLFKNALTSDGIVDILASSVGSLTNPRKIYDTFKSKGEKELSINTINS